MAYLIDLASIKSGGGLQLALNFIAASRESLGGGRTDSGNVFFLVSSVMESQARKMGCAVIGVAPEDLIGRAYFEYIKVPRLIIANQISAIYTFFGAGLPRTSGAKSIVSVAYPIICYPESSYWQYVPAIEGLKKRIWNFVRVMRLRRADTVVCETEVMKTRLKPLLKAGAEVVVLPPSPTEFLPGVDVEAGWSKIRSSRDILVLSGVAYHKNVWRLYDVARDAREMGIGFRLICSFRFEEFKSVVLSVLGVEEFDSELVHQYFDFRGGIPPEMIGDLYAGAAALLNISDLESFSNNYMEAWKTSTPLICSDRDFSRHICGESALYCNPHDPNEVLSSIVRLFSMSREEVIHMLEAGKSLLSSLPSQSEKASVVWGLLRAEK